MPNLNQQHLKWLPGCYLHLYGFEETNPVVELGEAVNTGSRPLEIQEQHQRHQGKQKAVEHDIHIQPLQDNAQNSHREGLQQSVTQGAIHLLPVAQIADRDAGHLHQHRSIANRVERSPAVVTLLVKVEQPAIP